MVILTIATTLSLYAGQEGMLKREFGREVTVSARPSEGGLSEEEVNALVDETLAEAGVQAIHRNTYRYTAFHAQKEGGLLSPKQDLGPTAPLLSLTVLPAGGLQPHGRAKPHPGAQPRPWSSPTARPTAAAP